MESQVDEWATRQRIRPEETFSSGDSSFYIFLEIPVLVDVGVETYTAKTFSDRRYEIWTMQSAYHNLPTADGVIQKDRREFRACPLRQGSL